MHKMVSGTPTYLHFLNLLIFKKIFNFAAYADVRRQPAQFAKKTSAQSGVYKEY